MGYDRELSRAKFINLFRTAIAGGAVALTRASWQWDISGDCRKPVIVSCFYRSYTEPDHKRVAKQQMSKGRHTLEMHVRCRKCPECKGQRRRMWAARSIVEHSRAMRTWFCTLTFKPEVVLKSKYAAILSCSRRAVDYDSLNTLEQFAEDVKIHNEHLTLFLKRLRKRIADREKQRGHPVPKNFLRYVACAEAHKSGVVHFHINIYECHLTAQVKWKDIAKAWMQYGHMKANLVTSLSRACYASKYVSKNLEVRVRASQGFGGPARPAGDSLPPLG